MTSTDLSTFDPESAYLALRSASTAEDRRAAADYARDTARLSKAGVPIPRLFMDLPWAGDDDDSVDQILTNLIMADDIYAATSQDKLPKAGDLIGEWITVNDVRVRESDVEDAAWGAYLVIDITRENGNRTAASTGAQQAVITLWRLWCDGQFPVHGKFVLLGNPTKGRNQPIGFVATRPL